MEEVLGRHIDDAAFDRYLAHWQAVMADRIDQATTAFAAIDGIQGLILAGSNGAGQPWPLSDIDLIPIYADDLARTAGERVEQVRLAILDEWSTQGWRTGLDIGRLHFRAGEITTAFADSEPDPLSLLADDRWYHTIDKAYQGRALVDRNGSASRLAAWFTAHRFDPDVVALRLHRSAREARASLDAVSRHLTETDLPAAFAALLKSIGWLQVHLMERWGERDNSLGRFGTRFALMAVRHGMVDLADTLDTLAGLDDASVTCRLERAPAWVHERNDRSCKARRAINEDVTRLHGDRDVLRVCAIYELRVVSGPPYPAWLAIPDAQTLRDRVATLRTLLDHQL